MTGGLSEGNRLLPHKFQTKELADARVKAPDSFPHSLNRESSSDPKKYST